MKKNTSSNKLLYILLTAMSAVIFIPSNAQVKVTDGADLTMDANSILELESSDKGLLIPRLAINDLNLPAPLTAPVPTGMLVYSTGGTVADGFYYWKGTAWTILTTGIGGQWITNGTNIYYNTGNVGIGVTVPTEPLEVNGNVKIGSTTTGTIRATNELVLRQDGDVYGPSILRLRNRTGENGAIFETTDGSITLIDFIFKNALHQRNIRFESRATYAKTGAPSFHLGGASPDNPTLSLGDNYAAFNKNVRIGDYTTPLTALDVNGQITLRTGAINGAVLVSNASGTGTWTSLLPVASGGTGLASGISGGIPAYTGTATITSSGLLTQNALVTGGGAGAAPSTIPTGIDGQILTSNGSSAPSWQETEKLVYLNTSRTVTGTTLTDATGLSFTANANKDYYVEFNIIYTTSSTTRGISLSVSGPPAPTGLAFENIGFSNGTTIVGRTYNSYDATGNFGNALAGNNYATVSGIFRNGNNSGTFILRFAAENAASTATIEVSSILKYRLLN